MEKLMARDLVQKTTQELKVLEEQCRAELFAVRFQQAIGSLEKSHRIPALRYQIARILTVLSQRAKSENVHYQLKGTILQQEYKQAAAQLETETAAFQKKAEAKLAEQQAAATGFNPDMIEEMTALTDQNAAETPSTSETVAPQPVTEAAAQEDKHE